MTGVASYIDEAIGGGAEITGRPLLEPCPHRVWYANGLAKWCARCGKDYPGSWPHEAAG